ncbi:MAG: hypothetical protein N2050_04275 [Flavobacteriales bacterium]|nr:hypothetical protein [Flavobacteriales bacterium]
MQAYSGTGWRYAALRAATQGPGFFKKNKENRPGGAGKPARGGRAWAAAAGRSDRQEAPGRPTPPPARPADLQAETDKAAYIEKPLCIMKLQAFNIESFTSAQRASGPGIKKLSFFLRPLP